jgi:lipopolysaccharide export LptBFGC system permease protein LptF
MVWGIWSALQSMIKLEFLSPLIGSWGVHIVASALAFLWIKRQNSHGA